jgi:hypothetical protein
MNLRARVYVEKQKKDAEEKFAARLAMMKEKGISPEKVQKDATVRRLKAELKQANKRLASIVAQEKLNQERALATEQKIAAKKAEREAALKGTPAEPAEKKEKKGKKEKPGREAKPEKKKEKKEKKPEAAPETK